MATPTKTEEKKLPTFQMNFCDSAETLDALIQNNMINEDELYYFPDPIPSAANNVALLGADGRIIDSGKQLPDTSGKVDKKVPSATNNVALLDAGGNLVDSGKQLTPTGIGAAATSHTHDAAEVISGTFSLDRIPEITNAKLAATCVTNAKIASDAVTTGKINSKAVTTAKLADNAVTTAKLSTEFYGTWTPVMDGATSYTTQAGQYIKMGDMVILSFQLYGTFAGSSTTGIKITGAPYVPTNNHVGGGGQLSGYTAASNVVFIGWGMNTAGGIYANGQQTGQAAGDGNKWGTTNIYQKPSGAFSASGTLMFTTSTASTTADEPEDGTNIKYQTSENGQRKTQGLEIPGFFFLPMA